MEIESIDTEISRQPQKRKKSEEIFRPPEGKFEEDEDRDGRSELISSPDIPPSVYFSERTSLANQTCWSLGFFLIAVGAVGFVAPTIWNFHFGYAHNIMNLLAGVITMWVGLTKRGATAKKYSFWAGMVFFWVGVAGFIFGQNVIVNGAVDARYVMTWIPGSAEFGRWDHYLHAAVGAVFLVAATLSKSKRVKT